MNYWLMKCEFSECSFDDLKNNRPNSTGKWRGVRNYQARNFIRDDMRTGDVVLFYQSNCDEPGIAGLAEIVRAAYPDPSAFDTGERATTMPNRRPTIHAGSPWTSNGKRPSRRMFISKTSRPIPH